MCVDGSAAHFRGRGEWGSGAILSIRNWRTEGLMNKQIIEIIDREINKQQLVY
jgi:hypothetical protein